jgi:hypothetical protein
VIGAYNIDRRDGDLAARRHRLDGDGKLSTDGVALLLIARQSAVALPMNFGIQTRRSRPFIGREFSSASIGYHITGLSPLGID